MKIKTIHTENLKKLVGRNDIVLNGNSASVFMENRGGKTTATADAISWLLFDKDSVGNSKPELTPIINNIVQHDLDTSVEITFLLPDGQMITLKKVYKTLTGKKGAKAGKVIGHTTDHYINGEYIEKKADYDQVVSQIAEAKQFRTLTDPLYFNHPDPKVMPWRERRNTILEMAGVSPEEINANNARMTTLKKQRSELQKKKDGKDSEIKGAKGNLPEQASSTGPNLVDLRKELATKQEDRSTLLAIGNSGTLKKQITEIETQLLKIKNQHTEKIQGQISDINVELMPIIAKQTDNSLQVSSKRRQVAALLEEEKGLNEKQVKLKEEYKQVSVEKWTGETSCPTCNRPLLDETIAEAEKRFNFNKSESLEKINQQGLANKTRLDEIKTESSKLNLDINALNQQITELQEKEKAHKAKITELEGMLNQVESLPEYKETQARLETLNKSLQEAKLTVDTTEIDEEIKGLEGQIAEQETIKAKLEQREKSLEGIKVMEVELKELSKELEGVEKAIYELNQLILNQSTALEDKIDSLFEFITYKMFDVTIDGEVNECCYCINKEGVPYDYFSESEKRRAGLDFIRAYSKFLGLDMPVIIDNRDLITDIPDMNGVQIISLYVSPDDKTLRVETVEKERQEVLV